MTGAAELRELREVPPAEMAGATLSDPEGGGRLQLRWLSTPVGKVASSFWDRQLEPPCQPEAFADNTIRCVPTVSFHSVGYFADSACREPLVVPNVHDWVPRDCKGVRYNIVRLTGGPGGIQVHRVGAEYRGPVFYSRAAGDCKETGFDSRPPTWRFGAEVPFNELAELTQVVR